MKTEEKSKNKSVGNRIGEGKKQSTRREREWEVVKNEIQGKSMKELTGIVVRRKVKIVDKIWNREREVKMDKEFKEKLLGLK